MPESHGRGDPAFPLAGGAGPAGARRLRGHRGAIPGHVPSDPEPPPGVDSGDPGIGRAARRRAPVERIMKPTRRKEEGMARESSGVIWMNGTFVPYEDAKIHVLSHVVHYGSSVFEGIRAYATPGGTAIFRLDRHVHRMLDSCKIARREGPFGYDELMDATPEPGRRTGSGAG